MFHATPYHAGRAQLGGGRNTVFEKTNPKGMCYGTGGGKGPRPGPKGGKCLDAEEGSKLKLFQETEWTAEMYREKKGGKLNDALETRGSLKGKGRESSATREKRTSYRKSMITGDKPEWKKNSTRKSKSGRRFQREGKEHLKKHQAERGKVRQKERKAPMKTYQNRPILKIGESKRGKWQTQGRRGLADLGQQ